MRNCELTISGGNEHMYHIKNDKRMRTSANAIVDGLVKCLQLESLQSITVTEVQRTSGVGRSTFYRLFDDLSDVLLYKSDQLFAEMVAERRRRSGAEANSLPSYFVKQWLNNSTILETIVTSHRDDILFSGFEKCFADLKDYLLPNSQLDEATNDYIVALAASAVVASLKTWIRHGKAETAEELLQHVRQASAIFNTIQSIE